MSTQHKHSPEYLNMERKAVTKNEYLTDSRMSGASVEYSLSIYHQLLDRDCFVYASDIGCSPPGLHYMVGTMRFAKETGARNLH